MRQSRMMVGSDDHWGPRLHLGSILSRDFADGCRT
jgi:hypothetical protein